MIGYPKARPGQDGAGRRSQWANAAIRRMTGQPGGVALSNYVAGRGRSGPGRTSPLSSSVGMKLAGAVAGEVRGGTIVRIVRSQS
jgi:hypothetical protein